MTKSSIFDLKSSICNRFCARLVLGAAVSTFVALTAGAQQEQPTLDQLLNLQPAPESPESPASPKPDGDEAGKKPAVPVAPERPGKLFDKQLQRQLDQPAGQELFQAAVVEMDQAAVLLQQDRNPGVQTQRIQESILAKLEQVIKEAKQNQQQSQSQSKARQQEKPSDGQPQQQSGQAQPGGMTPSQGRVAPGRVTGVVGQDDGALGQAGQEWGNLPPRLRLELQQGTQEHFSPVYRSLTERYYQRLSQESGQ